MRSGLLVAEGSSDRPLGNLVERLFARRSWTVDIRTPDLASLPVQIGSTVRAKLAASLNLQPQPDVVVVHRDSDQAPVVNRVEEMETGCDGIIDTSCLVRVVPVRMTEAWLLLDDAAIRNVAGNPNGRVELHLPTLREVERIADPKGLLREALLVASETTGRRRDTIGKRFGNHRRQLLEGLDIDGQVCQTQGFARLVSEVDAVCRTWAQDGPPH